MSNSHLINRFTFLSGYQRIDGSLLSTYSTPRRTGQTNERTTTIINQTNFPCFNVDKRWQNEIEWNPYLIKQNEHLIRNRWNDSRYFRYWWLMVAVNLIQCYLQSLPPTTAIIPMFLIVNVLHMVFCRFIAQSFWHLAIEWRPIYLYLTVNGERFNRKRMAKRIFSYFLSQSYEKCFNVIG